MMPRDLPLFTWIMVRAMLWDPTIRLGLAMREAPLHGAELAYKEGDTWKTGIKCHRPEVAQFLERQIQRFWTNDLRKVTKAQVWGWMGAEVLYRIGEAGQIEFDSLLQRSASDVRALQVDGKLWGVRFRRVPTAKDGMVDLRFPDCLWHAFMPEDGSLYGNSILRGPYSPWCDKYLDGGALDVRRLFMHKDAYGGVDVAYPPGTTYIDGKGEVPNQDIGRDIAQKIKAGGVTTRPSTTDDKGNELWKITRAAVPASPTHILEYPKDLDVEMLRGLEIPDDVLTSENTGAWAGKAIPQQAFYAGLDRWLANIAADLKTQILEPLVRWNFHGKVEFEVRFKPLAEQASEQTGDKEGGSGGGSGGFPMNPFAPNYGMPAQRMAIDPVLAVGEGVLSAGELVKAARKAIRRRKKEREEQPANTKAS